MYAVVHTADCWGRAKGMQNGFSTRHSSDIIYMLIGAGVAILVVALIFFAVSKNKKPKK